MRELARYSEVLPLIEKLMPEATKEEQLKANVELWEFFDAVWAIADRLANEEEAAMRDKSSAPVRLSSSHNI